MTGTTAAEAVSPEEAMEEARNGQEEDGHSAEMAEELRRLKRLGVFTTVFCLFWMSLLLLPAIYTIVLVLVGVLCLVYPCLFSSAIPAPNPPTSILENASDINHDVQVSIAFDKTRSEIRSCETPRLITGPPEGIYDIVYAAEYYGRVLRSEGELWIRFRPVSNGWEVEGQIHAKSGQQTSCIQDAFLNSQGHFYWTANGGAAGKYILYRGIFDLDTNEMHEGEFQSQDQALSGRVVRLALSRATELQFTDIQESNSNEPHMLAEKKDWGSMDIEMVTAAAENSEHVLPDIS